MKNTIIIIAVLTIVGIGIYYVAVNKSFNKNPVHTPPISNNSDTNTSLPATHTAPASNTPAKALTPSNITVNIKNFSFNPSVLTVKVGTKVTWVNNDSAPHTITSDSDNLLNSPTLSPGQSFSFIFTNAIAENYHCTIHPIMKGSIIVQD